MKKKKKKKKLPFYQVMTKVKYFWLYSLTLLEFISNVNNKSKKLTNKLIISW